MFLDLTTEVSKEKIQHPFGPGVPFEDADRLFGHWGTHFDCMDKVFPLEYLKRKAVFFDVSSVDGRDINVKDIDLGVIEEGMFVGFFTGVLNRFPFGTQEYFRDHPQLANELIDALLDKKVSIIGVDCTGVRRGAEHTPADQKCADRGTFIVENLCKLETVIGKTNLSVYTFPVKFTGMTGLPCRVVAEVTC